MIDIYSFFVGVVAVLLLQFVIHVVNIVLVFHVEREESI